MKNQDLSEKRRRIELTRERMGETIDAIAYKLDVPSRVRERVNSGVSAAKQKVAESMTTAKEALRSGIDAASGPPVETSSQSDGRPARGS